MNNEVFDKDEFASVWNSSSSVTEAARRLNIPYQTCHSRACNLKQNYGYNLKRFRQVNKKEEIWMGDDW